MPRILSVSRPEPRSYFLSAEQGTGLLAWDAVLARLGQARNYWLATASSAGLPHSMPVWGVWLEGEFLFSTSPRTRKARNLIENPHATVHLESGADVVVVEGRATPLTDPERIDRFLEAYNPKYDWNFTPQDVAEGLFAVVPRKAFAWSGDEGELFTGTGTRWTFAESEDSEFEDSESEDTESEDTAPEEAE